MHHFGSVVVPLIRHYDVFGLSKCDIGPNEIGPCVSNVY